MNSRGNKAMAMLVMKAKTLNQTASLSALLGFGGHPSIEKTLAGGASFISVLLCPGVSVMAIAEGCASRMSFDSLANNPIPSTDCSRPTEPFQPLRSMIVPAFDFQTIRRQSCWSLGSNSKNYGKHKIFYHRSARFIYSKSEMRDNNENEIE